MEGEEMVNSLEAMIEAERTGFHAELTKNVLAVKGHRPTDLLPIYTNADGDSQTSIELAAGMARNFPEGGAVPLKGSESGRKFERAVDGFLSGSLHALENLMPWTLTVESGRPISEFSQYAHLARIKEEISSDPEMAIIFGHDYIVTPDLTLKRSPLSVDHLSESFLDDRSETNESDFLHASVSCKWTIRSDRGQNVRTEARNLISSRRGRTPHIVAVTMEPLPSRIASVAIGTGDVDCVYHGALNELEKATHQLVAGREGTRSERSAREQADALDTMIRGGRLRDISALPFDLIS